MRSSSAFSRRLEVTNDLRRPQALLGIHTGLDGCCTISTVRAPVALRYGDSEAMEDSVLSSDDSEIHENI